MWVCRHSWKHLFLQPFILFQIRVFGAVSLSNAACVRETSSERNGEPPFFFSDAMKCRFSVSAAFHFISCNSFLLFFFGAAAHTTRLRTPSRMHLYGRTCSLTII